MRFKHVAILAPAFTPSFEPTLQFAAILVQQKVKVTLITAERFRERVADAGCDFLAWDMVHTTWVMTGFPTREDDDRQRQSGFLRATEKGATRTLLFQVDQAQERLLTDFPETLASLRELSKNLKPDVWVVDQLAHSVVLACYALELPFHSLCVAHPAVIPTGDQLFGVPAPWPENVPPHEGRAELLIKQSKKLQTTLNQRAAALLAEHAPNRPVPERFTSLCGDEVLFNYPEFDDSHAKRLNKPCHFLGACFKAAESLSDFWDDILVRDKDRYKILVSMGHILNARNDVLARILLAVRRHFPNFAVYVASGSSDRGLTHFRSDNVVIAEEIPLAEVLPLVDLAIFHGGVNHFTEAVYFGVPMINMPLSFDQYAIAREAEDLKIALALDPNHFDANEITSAVSSRLIKDNHEKLEEWSEKLRENPAEKVIAGWLR